MSMTRTFHRIVRGARLPDEWGGKARGLQLIADAGLPCPRSWVIPPGVDEGDLSCLVSRLETEGARLFAVRSSAVEEDAAGVSFAGIHESRLGVTIDGVPAACRIVASSPFSERANTYRAQSGLGSAGGPCAVVVQDLVDADRAGVAFGMRDRDEVVIEAVDGLGETAVDGQAIPETLTVRQSRKGWEVERRRSRLQRSLVTVEDDRIVRKQVPPDRTRSRVLGDRQAIEIATGVAALERRAGHPLDVEWALRAGELWFLQARPQTRPIGNTLPPRQIWTRANAREVLPDIPSALARSAIREALDGGERAWLGRHGVRIEGTMPLFTFVYGRPVFNERVFAIGDLLGVPRSAVEADLGGTSTAGVPFERWSFKQALRHPVVLLRAVLALTGAERRALRFIAAIRNDRVQLASVEPRSCADGYLREKFVGAQAKKLGEMITHALGVASLLARAQYFALDALRTFPYPRALLSLLLGDGGQTVSTRQLEEMLDVAIVMRQWSGGADFLARSAVESASISVWRERIPPAVWILVSRWVEKYGHRGPFESDISQPRYVDDLSMLARALLPLVATSARIESSRSRMDRRRRVANAAWREIEERLGKVRTWWLRRIVADIKRLMALREDLRNETVASFVYLRRFAQELGRRLTARNRIPAPEDVWHLSMEELDRAFSDAYFDAALAIARERSRVAAWRRITVPNRFTTEEVPALADGTPGRDDDAELYIGVGVSPGIAEAQVNVIHSPIDGDELETGSVLVAPATDPSWTPLFARAVGVVVEIGGALSHAGIVAREYGVPCVANIEGATRRLRDGDLVRVDGTRGVVTVVSRRGTERPGDFADEPAPPSGPSRAGIESRSLVSSVTTADDAAT